MSHPGKKLGEIGASARKNFSQNFLTSPHWRERLAGAAIGTPSDVIWEVGPGLGAITSQIVAQNTAAKPVVAFEIDRKLAANLREEYRTIQVVEGDFLEVDIATLAKGQTISLLSNLPYHISTAILFKLLEERTYFSQLVLTFQREVAERLKAEPRAPDYGALSVLVQCCFTISSLGVIPPGAFYPVPSVDSEGLVLVPIRDLPIDFQSLRRVVKQAFTHRRKKLSSNLGAILPKKECEIYLAEKLGLPASARPEELSPHDYVLLTQQLLAPGE